MGRTYPYHGLLVGIGKNQLSPGQVRGVIHHGGAGTTYAGLRAGCPTFIMAFGGDQLFWGLQVQERNLGPKPLNLAKGDWTVEDIKSGIRELTDGPGFSAKPLPQFL